LELILSVLFDTYPEVVIGLVDSLVKAGLTSSRISDLVYWLFLLFLVASFVRGILSSSFGWLFTRVDENLLSASPISPHALYIAKKVKGFLVHFIGVTMLVIAGFPFISRIGFSGIRLVFLFLSLLAILEFYGLTENVFHCLSRALLVRRRSSKMLGLVCLVILSSFIVAIPLLIILGVNLGIVNLLLNLYPPYILSRILTLNPSLDIASGTVTLLGTTVVFFIIAASIARFGLKRWSSSPRLAQTRGSFLQLRKNELKWRHGSKNDVSLILMKDFWVTIRNPAKFLIPLAIALVLTVFTLQFESVFSLPQPQLEAARYTEPIFLLSIYFIAVFVLPPAWDSFAGERRTVYLLKTSPVDPSSIVKGKYLFALIKSLLYVTPIVVAVSFVIPHTLDVSIALFEVILILFVSNAVGVLASVSYPPAYRGVGPPPFLIVMGLPLLSALLTAIIPLSFMAYYVDPTLFVFTSMSMLFYSFLVLVICVKRATRSFIRLQEI
jgi:hypothetical protein